MLNFPLALTLRLGARYNCRFLFWAGLSMDSTVSKIPNATPLTNNSSAPEPVSLYKKYKS